MNDNNSFPRNEKDGMVSVYRIVFPAYVSAHKKAQKH